MKEQILTLLEENNKQELLELIKSTYPIDIAIILEDFDDEILLKFYHLVDDKIMAQILEQGNVELQVRFINLIDYLNVIKLFSFMSKDDITDILANLSIQMQKDLLKLMKAPDTISIQELLGYAEDSAGGIMTTEYIALKGDLTISEAINKIKQIGPKTEIIEVIFVLNNNKELVGKADLRDILITENSKKLYEIMKENVITVNPEDDQEEVSLLVSKYDLKAIPVVNRKKHLLGIITVDDIIDVIVEEQTEDILRLSGASKEEKIDSSLSISITRRLPWLFINLATAFLASFTVGLFEDIIVQVVALAAAMPIVTGMGGNAGSQTLAIVIRSIALGEVDSKKNWKLVFKQIILGLINGAAIGIITGIILYFKYDNPYLGLIIFIAMVANLIIAGLFGFLIPLILKKLGVDPALASSIFLTTITDVCGFFIFLGLARIFLPLLI